MGPLSGALFPACEFRTRLERNLGRARTKPVGTRRVRPELCTPRGWSVSGWGVRALGSGEFGHLLLEINGCVCSLRN